MTRKSNLLQYYAESSIINWKKLNEIQIVQINHLEFFVEIKRQKTNIKTLILIFMFWDLQQAIT